MTDSNLNVEVVVRENPKTNDIMDFCSLKSGQDQLAIKLTDIDQLYTEYIAEAHNTEVLGNIPVKVVTTSPYRHDKTETIEEIISNNILCEEKKNLELCGKLNKSLIKPQAKPSDVIESKVKCISHTPKKKTPTISHIVSTSNSETVLKKKEVLYFGVPAFTGIKKTTQQIPFSFDNRKKSLDVKKGDKVLQPQGTEMSTPRHPFRTPPLSKCKSSSLQSVEYNLKKLDIIATPRTLKYDNNGGPEKKRNFSHMHEDRKIQSCKPVIKHGTSNENVNPKSGTVYRVKKLLFAKDNAPKYEKCKPFLSTPCLLGSGKGNQSNTINRNNTDLQLKYKSISNVACKSNKDRAVQCSQNKKVTQGIRRTESYPANRMSVSTITSCAEVEEK